MNRHNFNRKRVARRRASALAQELENRERELMGSRQSWDEWQVIAAMRNQWSNLFKQERG